MVMATTVHSWTERRRVNSNSVPPAVAAVAVQQAITAMWTTMATSVNPAEKNLKSNNQLAVTANCTFTITAMRGQCQQHLPYCLGASGCCCVASSNRNSKANLWQEKSNICMASWLSYFWIFCFSLPPLMMRQTMADISNNRSNNQMVQMHTVQAQGWVMTIAQRR